MSGSISLNPYATNAPVGSFLSQTQGYVQGAMDDDPAVRMEITAGYLLGTQTIPMWPGVAIQELINITGSGADGLGSAVARSTSVATVSGLCVYNQNHSMVIAPGGTAPVQGINGNVHYVRLGTNARVAVQCAASLVASLAGDQTTQQVSWDFTNQLLVPYNAAWNANAITAASWAATNGGQVTFTTTSAHGVAVGSAFTITGMTPAGYNGDFTAITGTTGSTLVAVLTTNPGAETGLGTLVAGGGAFPCRVLSINTNSKIIAPYTAGSPLLWTTGAAAKILI